MRKKILSMVMVLTLIIGLSSCTNPDTNEPTSTTEGSTNRISIVTGGSGGVFYTLGAGMADIMNNNSASIEAVSETTAATAENLKLIQMGEAEVGFTVYDALVDAYEGNEPYTKHDELRLIMRGHSGYVHIYTPASSGIETIEDFEGKRISMAPGDIGVALLSNTLSPYGLTMDDVSGQPMSITETNTGFQDKTIDVGFQTMGLPGSSIMEITNMMDVKFISIDEDKLDSIIQNKPAWAKSVIPAGTYKGQTEDVNALQIPYAIFANVNTPDEVVYDFLKTLLENTSALEKMHVEGAHYTKDNALFNDLSPVPYHPGAEKYLKEQGILE